MPKASTFSAEDIVITIAIVITLLLAPLLTALWYLDDPILVPPPIIAIFLGIAVSALLYRFLGGVHDASFTVGALKVTGTAAILIFVAWWSNDELKMYMPETRSQFKLENDVSPSADSWFAVSQETGKPINLTFPKHNQFQPAPSISDLNQQMMFRELDLDSLDHSLVVKTKANHNGLDDQILGRLNREELNAFGFFNDIGIDLEPFPVATLGASETVDLNSKLPFTIKTKGFNDNYTSFSLNARNDGSIIHEDAILLRGAKLFEYNNRYYLISVIQVNHAPEDIDPYAKIYVAEIKINYS